MRIARALAKDMSPRALEELSVEGTALAADSSIDIRFGDPIDVGSYLHRPEFEELLACGEDDIEAIARMDEASGLGSAEALVPRIAASFERVARGENRGYVCVAPVKGEVDCASSPAKSYETLPRISGVTIPFSVGTLTW